MGGQGVGDTSRRVWWCRPMRALIPRGKIVESFFWGGGGGRGANWRESYAPMALVMPSTSITQPHSRAHARACRSHRAPCPPRGASGARDVLEGGGGGGLKGGGRGVWLGPPSVKNVTSVQKKSSNHAILFVR